MIKHAVWDEWKVQWCIMVNDIMEVPQIVGHKLVFKSRQVRKSHIAGIIMVLLHFHDIIFLRIHFLQEEMTNEDRSIEHQDVQILFWIQKMIEIVFIINLENKPYSFVESQVSKT